MLISVLSSKLFYLISLADFLRSPYLSITKINDAIAAKLRGYFAAESLYFLKERLSWQSKAVSANQLQGYQVEI